MEKKLGQQDPASEKLIQRGLKSLAMIWDDARDGEHRFPHMIAAAS